MARYRGEGAAWVVPMSSLNDHLPGVEGLGGGPSANGDAAGEWRGRETQLFAWRPPPCRRVSAEGIRVSQGKSHCPAGELMSLPFQDETRNQLLWRLTVSPDVHLEPHSKQILLIPAKQQQLCWFWPQGCVSGPLRRERQTERGFFKHQDSDAPGPAC